MARSERPGGAACWHLYVVRTVDGFLYTGISTDVARRFAEHTAMGRKSARFLRTRKPLCIAFSQAIGNRPLALRVERHFKALSKKDKEQIVSAGSLAFDSESGGITLTAGKPPEVGQLFR